MIAQLLRNLDGVCMCVVWVEVEIGDVKGWYE